MDQPIHIEFLVEDYSGKLLLEKIMEKYSSFFSNVTYRINGFRGIGRLPKVSGKISQIKTHSLLNDLPAYLKGISKSLSSFPKKAIVVVLDGDDKNCKVLKEQLLALADTLQLETDTFFCIAIEEMEAWLLGDTDAILAAYPEGKRTLLHSYSPDSIIGTWEFLADAIYAGGAARLKKEAAYSEIGKQKCEWAKLIGRHLNLRENKSPSFNYFLSKLDYICALD